MTKTVQFQRECMQDNARFVQTHAKFEELEYANFIYEMGLGFLNVCCLENPKLKTQLERDAKFWKWFRNEFFHYESAVLKAHDIVAGEHGVPVVLDRTLYVSEMAYMFTEPGIDLSFAHFLTLCRYA
jgi:hypothetical protein